MTRRILIGALCAFFATFAWADSKASETRIRTALSGGAIAGQAPSGNADFRSETRGRSRLNVEVEHVNEADGTTLTVMVVHNGTSTSLGTIHLKAGFGELELNSQDGEAVPAIVKGDMVVVSDGGGAILSGVF